MLLPVLTRNGFSFFLTALFGRSFLCVVEPSRVSQLLRTIMKNELQKLMELDARHNELLERLEELDIKVLGVLNEWSQSGDESSSKTSKMELKHSTVDRSETVERPAA